VRETLFNWLGHDLAELATLELFAGSGVLSLEALSRGARQAVAVDRERRAIAALADTATAFGVRAACATSGERRRHRAAPQPAPAQAVA
jgi:16S rRNA (guanine966-N2)-methyltransferase